ncbi:MULTISPECIES: DUF2182 domain-containing protein [unclassified Caballeronia]|uniref:DUF2182 domain-containing protein n=1 Tax=unclassified Caballeronia TaxID=2646786 RepID=UPI00202999CB|nr:MULTISPECIES: DUF2182 domain-containing protein [unclassified Caballeronia]
MTSTPTDLVMLSGDERRGLVALLAFAFALSAALLAACHACMPSMDWARPCGQTPLGAAVSFVAAWAVMMNAMMLPPFAQTLWRYRRCGAAALALMTAGYVTAWSMTGIAMYPLRTTWSVLFMTKPVTGGAVIVLAGMVQSSRWKARRLARCRSISEHRSTMLASYEHGIWHGMQCIASCAALTVALCVAGMTDSRAMAAVTFAIAAERLLPFGHRVAKGIGVLMIAAGAAWMLHAVA